MALVITVIDRAHPDRDRKLLVLSDKLARTLDRPTPPALRGATFTVRR